MINLPIRFILLLSTCLPIMAESVTRGPYLQNATQTSIVICWRTEVPSTSKVAYAQQGGDVAITRSVMTEATLGLNHAVEITGLKPGTRYHYAVVGEGADPQVIRFEEMYNFTTAPAVETAPVRIWALGDCGTANANQKAVRDSFYAHNKGPRTDVVLLLGDNAYTKGLDNEYQRAIFDIYPSSLSQSVFWSTVGNHDTASDANPALTIPYFQIFVNPVRGEAGGLASGTEKYYSFDHGPVHFVCLDSMTSERTAKSAMAVWAAKDLSATTKPWIIAFWHHPPYTKGSHDSDKEKNLVEMREVFVPILEQHGVDLVLSGHSHSYERSYLLDGHYDVSATLTDAMKKDGGLGDDKKPYTKKSGPRQGAIYVVPGSAGKISGGTLNHPAMVVSLNELGSFVIDVAGNTLKARMLAPDQVIRDAFTLIKAE